MLLIAICDDEKSLRNDLRKLLEPELDLCGIDFKIDEFDCGEKLISALDTATFDILFLDIEMKGLNGIETAKELRKKTSITQIIFVTSYPDFVFQGYEVQALHYILKPYEQKKIVSVLHTAIELLEQNIEKHFVIEQKNGTIRIPVNKIYYFYSEKRFVNAVTESGTYSFYDKLSEITDQLPEYFIRIHNRYLVSLNYMEALHGDSIICHGEELPVSRSYKQELSIAFAKYMLH